MRRRAANRKIVIERFTETGQDTLGHPIKEWVSLTTLWAAVKQGAGAERREAAQVQASQAATFIVLDNSVTRTVMPLDRIAWDGSYWDIRSAVMSAEYNAEREITAVRIVP